MYKTTVTYEDFDGNQKTEDLYFNLTKAEITKLQLGTVGGFDKKIQSIIDSKDSTKIIALFEELILLSYGKRTEDGGFVKSKKISDEFSTTEAYSELFMTLISDEKAQKAFFLGIMPRDIASQVEGELKAQSIAKVANS